MTDNPWIPLFVTIENAIQPEQLAESEAEHFLTKAEAAIDSARHEITYGETISELLSAGEHGLNECHRSLATIGVWHFECSVELFHKAIRNFERAKKHGLSKSVRKEVEAQLRECRKQLGAATKQKEEAGNLLNSIGK